MKVFVRVTAVLVVIALLFVINDYCTVDRYSATVMYGSIEQKRERAASIEGEKVIIIGGSASNLGFDSQKFEELSGKPAANLALSAGIPLRVYMRVAELHANPGDVIIFPIEYGYYKDEFNKVSEDYVDIVAVDNQLQCDETVFNTMDYLMSRFLRSFTRINDCLLFDLRAAMGTEKTIYVADSVDAYGDFRMHEGREATYTCSPVDDPFEYLDGTMEEIREFVVEMEAKGVTVYITYPCVDKNHFEDRDAYFSAAQKAVEAYIPAANILGTPDDFGYETDAFFDTAYHLRYENRAGYTEDLYTIYQQKAE